MQFFSLTISCLQIFQPQSLVRSEQLCILNNFNLHSVHGYIYTHTYKMLLVIPSMLYKLLLRAIPVTHLLWYWASESLIEWSPQWTAKEQLQYPSLGKCSQRRDSLVLLIPSNRVVRSSLISPLSVSFTLLIPPASWPRDSLQKEFPRVNYALCKTVCYYSSHICCLLIFLGYSHTLRGTIRIWWPNFPNSRAS